RIPRPRNAFMIFRSEFWAGAKISKSVEHDHRHISRIVGHCWNQLTEEEKAVWRRRAEQEKIEHQIKYPGYRFSPNVRTKQVIKRNVKRNGEDEMLRCKQVAELLLAGKAGKELDTAVKSIDLSLGRDPPLVKSKKALEFPSDTNEYPAFRSPLLPPERPKIDTQAHQYSNEIRSSRNYQQQQCQSSWTLQYPNLPEVNNSSYPIQQYTSDPRTVPTRPKATMNPTQLILAMVSLALPLFRSTSSAPLITMVATNPIQLTATSLHPLSTRLLGLRRARVIDFHKSRVRSIPS
ncbi:Repressor ROX1, partial [Termitomyces sp. J132]